MRLLSATFEDFAEGHPLQVEVVLSNEPRDSMVIATPWAEDSRAFYYNQKIVGMDAIGGFALGDLRHDFHEDSSFWPARLGAWRVDIRQHLVLGHRAGHATGTSLRDEPGLWFR